ncbi:LLM class flavin-dependent oxidoreductase [Arthrobacter psychrolactophilus]
MNSSEQPRKDIMTNLDTPHPAFTPTGQLHFGVNVVGPAAELSFDELRTIAQTAERGVFSLLSLDERYWLRSDPGPVAATDPAGSNDVTTLLSALTAVTSHIGVVVAAAPDYDAPGDLTARIASLDQLSGGRAAWHILADGAVYGESPEEDAGEPSGRHALIEATQRAWSAPQAAEPTGPVETLGAFERDGQLYSVGLGALRQPVSPRAPLVMHDAGSPQESATAAAYADIVVTPPASLEEALAVRRTISASLESAGRGADHVRILQAATFILAPTHEEAAEKAAWMREQLPESVLDAKAFVGSYHEVAEQLLDFSRTGAVDGFMVMPWLFEDELTRIVNHLIPELQSRGAYPQDYAANTLRGNLVLPQRLPGAATDARHTLPVIEVGELDDVRLDLDLRMELIVQKL